MCHGLRRVLSFTLFLALLLVTATGAFAQGGATSTLAGTVTDSSGGVVPGADVTAKNNATATTYTAFPDFTSVFTRTDQRGIYKKKPQQDHGISDMAGRDLPTVRLRQR